MTAAIEVDGLSKRYGRTLALDEVSLSVPQNTLFALLGPNGAGKTTLIHILCTILQSDGGTALLNGIDIKRDPVKARQHIGVVFQEASLDDRLTAYENLDFHGLVYGMISGAERRARIDELLGIVELEQWRNATVRSFSGGMKRRLEIARGLMHRPSILFLDEPSVGLDAQSRARIWTYIEEMRRRQPLTVVITTHYIEEVEQVEQVAIIDKGKVIANGSPAELKHEHGREVVRVEPRDAVAAEAIKAAYPDAQAGSGGMLIIDASGPDFNETFLSRFGRDLKQVAFEQPSLESVFLTLTGRELRDRAADGREQQGAAGRRGRRS